MLRRAGQTSRGGTRREGAPSPVAEPPFSSKAHIPLPTWGVRFGGVLEEGEIGRGQREHRGDTPYFPPSVTPPKDCLQDLGGKGGRHAQRKGLGVLLGGRGRAGSRLPIRPLPNLAPPCKEGEEEGGDQNKEMTPPSLKPCKAFVQSRPSGLSSLWGWGGDWFFYFLKYIYICNAFLPLISPPIAHLLAGPLAGNPRGSKKARINKNFF